MSGCVAGGLEEHESAMETNKKKSEEMEGVGSIDCEGDKTGVTINWKDAIR